MKILLFSTICLVALLDFGTVFCGNFKYISPVPDSKLNSAKTNIILKQAEDIDKSCLSSGNIIDVYGSKSGKHDGDLILSDDNKTLIFNPKIPFNPGEEVNVKINMGIVTTSGKTINPLSFKFSVSPLKFPVSYEAIFEKNSIFTKSDDKLLADTLPSDLPLMTVNKINDPTPGNIFLANPKKIGTYGNYIMILNNDGTTLKYKKTKVRGYDFKMQPNGLYSYAEVINTQWFWGDVVMLVLNQNLDIIDSVQCGNGYVADMHEFLMMPNGHYFLLAQDVQPYDMSKIVTGGDTNALLAGSIIQELDENKNVVFQWRSWDYLDINDTYESLLGHQVNPVHFNAMDLDNDGNIILSVRHMCTILKINRQTGEIIWQLGGKKNQFTFIGEHDPIQSTYFSHQHNVRRIANGNITLFDNGWIRNPQFSRAVEYKLDETNKTATLVWEYRHQPDQYTDLMGSVQRLDNGNTLICWGGPNTIVQPEITEVKPDNSVALEMTFPRDVASYRAYKYVLPGCQPVSKAHNILYENNTYDFNDSINITGIKIKILKLESFVYNSIAVDRYECSAMNPRFSGRSPLVLPLRFFMTQSEIDTIYAEVHINLKSITGLKDPENYKVYFREKEGTGVFTPVQTTYNDKNDELVFYTSTFGEFILGKPDNVILPGVPSLIGPADKAKLNNTTDKRFSWTYKGYSTAFNFQMSQDTTFKDLIIDKTLNTSNYNALGFDYLLQKYYWRVKAINEAGSGDWSEIREINIDPYIEILYPNGGEQLYKDTSEYIIRWVDNIDDTVNISLFRNGSFFLKIKDSVFSNSRLYSWKIDSGIPPDSTYTITISSIHDNSVNAKSTNKFSISNSTTGLKSEANEASQIVIYPNPFSDITNIGFSIEKNTIVKMVIYDIDGNIISNILNSYLDAGSYRTDFNAADLPCGDYFLRLETDSNITLKKITVIR